ncbi:hypothetical protein [uncultured Chryseobacterium sp.]|uniref:hypothetical protein n=1 Tax=uncultured Chryseobacterium sp. TaxID=259322 RepID=UPI0025E1A86D|nr:hypothetical protein [uncultured Chryseobacterium sp.]
MNKEKLINMEVKNIWTDIDFEEMGWHDSHIYSILFPDERLKLVLDIDYIFKWVLNEETGFYNFWVSPCSLIFMDVLNLKIDINFENSIGLNIEDINRSNPRLSANGEVTLWDYSISTDIGAITFKSSGYKQQVKQQPVYSSSPLSRICNP